MDFRAVGKALSNWKRWGAEDRIGTLNHITPERVRAAAAAIRTGEILSLALPLGAKGPQVGVGGRTNPVHLMSLTPADFAHRSDGMVFSDDFIAMPLQCATQWDGLAHAGYDGLLYNGVPASTVTSARGSAELSIERIAERGGVTGRGVLLDVARALGVDRLEAGQPVTPADLDRAADEQGATVGPGDVLLVRTGWMRCWTVDNDPRRYWNGEPGLHLDCAAWLHARDVAAVCSDNWGVEVMPPDGGHRTDLHAVLLRDMGLSLGELFVLDALAEACAGRGAWDFFFTAPPLTVTGGVGSPITPLAIL